jgi:hypothetical protein
MTGEMLRPDIPDPDENDRKCKVSIRFVDISDEKARNLYRAIREV